MNAVQRNLLRLALAIACGALGCRTREPRGLTRSEPAGLIPSDPLSLVAAREAHRRAEARRHLRFLEAAEPGYLFKSTALLVSQERIDAGLVGIQDLLETGRLHFEHEHGFADGLGSADSRKEVEDKKSPFHRVHRGAFGGPETISCTSCHWRGGPAGSGALQDNSFILGDGDRVSTADPRNPPPLQGAGVVEALAREMSLELAEARRQVVDAARARGERVERELTAKGISFGVLGARADGTLDASKVEGVDEDLVVKPFGWKGASTTIRGFVAESLHLHLGLDAHDPTHAAGHGDEISDGQLTALTAYVALLELPVVRPPEVVRGLKPASKNLLPPTERSFHEEWARGREVFHEIGCVSCHRPFLVLKDPVLHLRSPTSEHAVELDLSKDGETPRLEYDPALGGYPVYLFSDLKRHDMGEENASKHEDHGVARRQYLTRRLWGVGSSPPYFHDGRAPWLDQAIEAHGGEAFAAVDNFKSLNRDDKGALRVYLLSLRRQPRLVVPE